MTKDNLIAEIAEKTNLKKTEVNAVLTTLGEVVLAKVRDAGDVVPIGFGTFKQKINEARMGRNPLTGEAVKIKRSKNIKFAPSFSIKKVD